MYDLAVIGAGWAGFNAAVRAAELGKKVALIEKDKLGGTCLNYGCIPTKSLLQSAKIYSLAKKSSKFGVAFDKAQFNLSAALKRKQSVVDQLQSGMQFFAKSKNINLIQGTAELLSEKELSIGGEAIKSDHILIAAGSQPIELPFLKFDGQKILSSNDIFNLENIPASLLIIGGGVIGCEFATIFNTLGSKVSIVELLPQILPQEDNEISRRLEACFKKKGISVSANTDVKTVSLDDYDAVLVSVGRRPCAEGLGLEKSGIATDKGRVIVDDYLRTNIPNIYAAGDCTGKIMLAHYASYQGRLVAENIAKVRAAKRADNENVPNCIFTDPEIASIGLDEKKAGEQNIEIDIKKIDFRSNAMAHILDEAEGFIKIICSKKTDEILGACVIGPKATELISVMTVAVQAHLKASKLKETIFAHPTLSEIIHEAL